MTLKGKFFGRNITETAPSIKSTSSLTSGKSSLATGVLQTHRSEQRLQPQKQYVQLQEQLQQPQEQHLQLKEQLQTTSLASRKTSLRTGTAPTAKEKYLFTTRGTINPATVITYPATGTANFDFRTTSPTPETTVSTAATPSSTTGTTSPHIEIRLDDFKLYFYTRLQGDIKINN